MPHVLWPRQVNFLRLLSSQGTLLWVLGRWLRSHRGSNKFPRFFQHFSPYPVNQKLQLQWNACYCCKLGNSPFNPFPISNIYCMFLNFLSIHQITNDLNFCHIFPTPCVLRDFPIGRTICHARRKGGLYLKPKIAMIFSPFFPICLENSIPRRDLGMALKIRPSFSIHYEVFEYAKHHHVPFPLSNKKVSILFTLTYNDV